MNQMLADPVSTSRGSGLRELQIADLSNKEIGIAIDNWQYNRPTRYREVVLTSFHLASSQFGTTPTRRNSVVPYLASSLLVYNNKSTPGLSEKVPSPLSPEWIC